MPEVAICPVLNGQLHQEHSSIPTASNLHTCKNQVPPQLIAIFKEANGSVRAVDYSLKKAINTEVANIARLQRQRQAIIT